jgi:hypothetical protein
LGDPPITPPDTPSFIPGTQSGTKTVKKADAGVLAHKKHQLRLYVKLNCHWHQLLGEGCARASRLAFHTRSLAYVHWALGKWKARSSHAHDRARRWMIQRAARYEAETATMQRMMGRTRTASKRQLARAGGIETRFSHARSQYQDALSDWRHPPHFSQLMCIHHGEGSWNSISNPKYKGGLQMDVYFEATYGAVFVVKYGGHIAADSNGHKYAVGGHANLWTPIEQMWAAENAIRSGRGFYPWPYTAHVCGLI